MKRTASTVAAILIWSAATFLFSAEPLRLQFQFSGVSEEQGATLEKIVRARVSERSPSGELNASYSIDASLEPEEYVLEMSGTSATVRAGSFPGLVFASGKLLRSIRYESDSFTVPELTLREKPDASFRCCYFARHFHNW